MSKINEAANRSDLEGLFEKASIHRAENRSEFVRRLPYFTLALLLSVVFFFILESLLDAALDNTPDELALQ